MAVAPFYDQSKWSATAEQEARDQPVHRLQSAASPFQQVCQSAGLFLGPLLVIAAVLTGLAATLPVTALWADGQSEGIMTASGSRAQWHKIGTGSVGFWDAFEDMSLALRAGQAVGPKAHLLRAGGDARSD
jgi:hypothetical protein